MHFLNFSSEMSNWENLFFYPPTSLNYAASNGDVVSLRDLLSKGKCPDAVDHRGWTALHVAAANNQYVSFCFLNIYKNCVLNFFYSTVPDLLQVGVCTSTSAGSPHKSFKTCS